jgi:hypothetical protein
LNGYPTVDQVIPIPGQDSYTEVCVNTPPAAAYWTYWIENAEGQWAYSIKGSSTNPVVFGSAQGYSFAHNQLPVASPPLIEPRNS